MSTYGTLSNQGALLEHTFTGLGLLKMRIGVRRRIAGKVVKITKPYARKYLRMSPITSIHNTVDGGKIGAPNTPVEVESRVYPRFQACSTGLTTVAARAESDALKGNKGGASNVAKYYINSMLETAVLYDNFMTFRDGTGIVALLGTTVSGSTITVSDGRLLLEGASYEIRSASTGAVLASFTVSKKANALTSGYVTVTLVSSIAANGQAAGDYITWGSGDRASYGKALTGTQALVNDSSATFQYVSGSSYPQWSSIVNDNAGTARAIDTRVIRNTMAAIKYRQDDSGFNNKKVRTVFTVPEIQAELEEMYESALRIAADTNQVGSPDGNMVFNSALGRWKFDSNYYLPYGEIQLIDQNEIVNCVWMELSPHGGEGKGGGLMGAYKATTSVLSQVAEFAESSNLMIFDRSTSARITNISMTPVSAR